MHSEFYRVLEVLGVAVFAFTGALAGLRARMDVAGVMVMSVIVGLGGGTARDLMLGRHPLGWMRDEWMLWLSLGTGLVVFIAAVRYGRERLSEEDGLLGRVLVWGDAVGLAVFCVSGAQVALIMGASNGIAILMGAVTCVGGGVVRDILVNRVPLVFQRDLYMTPALLGSGIYVVLEDLNWPSAIASIIAGGACFALRAAAIRYDLQAPR